MYRHLVFAVFLATSAACASNSSAGAEDSTPTSSADVDSRGLEEAETQQTTVEQPPEGFLQSVRERHAELTGELARCVDEQVGDDELAEATSVQLAFSVHPDGNAVQTFAAPAPEVRTPEFAECLEAIFADIEYAAPNSPQVFRRRVAIPVDDSQLTFGDITLDPVSGEASLTGLNAAVIRAIVRSWLPEIQACGSQTTGNAEASGRLVVRTHIPREGRELEASIEMSEVGDEGVESCAVDVFERMQFDRVPREKKNSILYPLNFGSRE